MNVLKRLYEKETKETIWSFATKGTAAVLFVILNAFLARTLGAALWGSWSFLLSVLTVVYLLSYMGQNNAARAYAARYNGTPSLRAVLRDSLLLRIALSALFTTVFFLLHDRIAGWIGRPDLAGLLRAAAPLIFLMGFSEYLKQIFTGIHRLKFHFVMNILDYGGKLALCVLLLASAVRLENVLLAFWLAVAGSVLVGFLFWSGFYRAPLEEGTTGRISAGAAPPGFGEIRAEKAESTPLIDAPSAQKPASPDAPAGETPAAEPPTRVPDSFLRAIFRYSLPLFLISIGFMVMTEIDTIMLGLLSTDLEVGHFAAAKQLANKLPQIALAVSMGTMPVFAKMDHASLEAMRDKFRGVLRLNAAIFLPGGALLILLAPWLVPLVFGPEYGPAVLPLQVLTLWVVMTSFNMFFNALLDYQGRAARRAVNFLLTIFLTVILNLLLIPRFGAAGAAVSTTVSFGPYVLLNYLEVRGVFQAA